MIYNIKDKIPFGKLCLFSLQMVLSIFVATVLIANLCGVPVSGALVGAGVSTLVYVLFTKAGSPMFMSNSGAFVAPVLMAMAAGGYTAIAVGGVVTALIYGLFGFIFTKVPVDKIYKVFPKSLIGAITAVIGINLMGFITTYVQIDGVTSMWGVSVALVTMISIALFSHYAKGALRILPFLIGTLIGYIYAVILTITNIYPIISFDAFRDMPFFSLPSFAFTKWEPVKIVVLIPVIITYIAYTISAICECLSDHAALSGIIEKDLYQEPGLPKIFIGEGLANIAGSCLGGLGICSYGESVACIGFSKVASVRVTVFAAILLAALGFITPVQVFIASIPSCVFAGAAMILYGYIACSGIKMLQKVDLNIQKNLIITSVVFSLGICGLAVGGSILSFSGTALALIVGIILNLILD